MAKKLVLTDDPSEGVRRLTLNQPEKRNALSNALRGELFEAIHAADADDDVRVTIIRGAGTCFSAGYDLGNANEGVPLPFYTAPGEGQWPRHVTEGWMSIWDLAKPVIAQVHGYCLAGGSELATGCDLVVVAEDAQIGYPAVRFGVPDMHFHAWFMGMRTAMDMMLTGDSISGTDAARLGWANYAYPAEELDDQVLAYAERIAKMPTDLVKLNKRLVHRTMEVMGLRTAIRMGTEICALGIHQPTLKQFVSDIQSGGLTETLSKRDAPYGDYRTSEEAPG
ncbi:MAG: enoyl-CoA hydratase-related protein [Acidimicrobiales bacterium]